MYINEILLRASAMLKHVIDIGWTSVRLSVCQSHAGTVLKRLNLLSRFLHHTIAHPF